MEGFSQVPASLDLIDEMVEFSLIRLSERPDGHRSVTRELVKRWPDVDGLQIVFVLVSAGHAVEKIFARDARFTSDEVEQAFRLAALVSVDLFALRIEGQLAPTGADLLDYWRKSDPYFLDL